MPNGLPIKSRGPCSLKCRLKALDVYPFRYEPRLGLVHPFANAAHVSCNAGSTEQHRLNKDERSALIARGEREEVVVRPYRTNVGRMPFESDPLAYLIVVRKELEMREVRAVPINRQLPVPIFEFGRAQGCQQNVLTFGVNQQPSYRCDSDRRSAGHWQRAGIGHIDWISNDGHGG